MDTNMQAEGLPQKAQISNHYDEMGARRQAMLRKAGTVEAQSRLDAFVAYTSMSQPVSQEAHIPTRPTLSRISLICGLLAVPRLPSVRSCLS